MNKKSYVKTFTLPNGKRKYVRAQTKEELDKKVLQLKLALNAGVDVSEKTSVSDFLDIWMDTYKRPRLRPSSMRALKSSVDLHIRPYFEGLDLSDVKPLHIQRFAVGESHLSRGTQSMLYAWLREFFNCAVENGLIIRSPVPRSLAPSGAARAEEQALTAEQARQLLDALEGMPQYTFVLLALTTGMRRGELLGLQWSDVDLVEGVIHVTHNMTVDAAGKGVVSNTPKSVAGERDIPLPPFTIEHLRSLKKTSLYVLPDKDGRALTNSRFVSWWEPVRRMIKRGVIGFPVHPHQLRHTYATNLVAAGLDPTAVRYLMGHSDIGITLQVYTHYNALERARSVKPQLTSAMPFLAGPAVQSGEG